MALIRWRTGNDVISQLDHLQHEMANLMAAYQPWAGGGAETFRPEVYPPLNIYDDGETFLVRAEVPGVDPKVIDVEATADTVTIRGERVLPEAGNNASYHRRERDSGQFRRSLTLPKPVDNTKVVATCTDGVLELRLPYAEEAKRRKITVKAS
ncbi:MAG: Hsp20/alpha crystallin family protein [Deltaproteobacteria bacterium]|nr:Hsp20/alpha crystallin family protein [Deltaproteobacteria bacterium]